MELCDVYNEKGERTGRVLERSLPLAEGEYRLVVGVWIVNSKNEILITQRSPEKSLCLINGKTRAAMYRRVKPDGKPWYGN